MRGKRLKNSSPCILTTRRTGDVLLGKLKGVHEDNNFADFQGNRRQKVFRKVHLTNFAPYIKHAYFFVVDSLSFPFFICFENNA